jgi:hypothetical protein
MKSLFEIGEEVILCSKNQPNLNGDTVVIKSAIGSSVLNCPHCEKKIELTSSGYGYFLEVKSKGEHGCCQPFDESALRKKHNGSNFSFNEIMSEINSIEKMNA